MADESIPESTRKEIFAAIVEAQDRGQKPKESRQNVADEYGVSIEQAREIETEGLEKTWPPLEECEDEG